MAPRSRALGMAGYELTAAIMQLLPVIQTVVSAHDPTAPATCPDCCPSATGDRRDCPTLRLAASGLDLVIECWKQQKSSTSAG